MEKKRLIDKLIKKVKLAGFKKNDLEKLEEAIVFADKKHINQKRKSGEPYIIHPLHTAITLVEWNMDLDTIIAGLLHDIIEDTDTSKKEIQEKFNEHIAELVDVVSKVTAFTKNSSKDMNSNKPDLIDYHMKVILSITNDHRAIIIKLADRLHNMQTISFLTHEKQIRIAQETLDIYANIAGRLGLYSIKTELQDLSFKVLYQTKAEILEESLNEFSKANQVAWQMFSDELDKIIQNTGISFEQTKRLKGLFSISKKMDEGKKLNDIHDLLGNRIIIDGSPEDCYKVLGLIHINFLIIPGTFKDYISSPKLNMYRSLHTTIKYKNMYIEIQIRTKEMDYEANHGIASHWKYKETNSKDSKLVDKLMSDIVAQNIQSQNKDDIKSAFSKKVFDVLILNNDEWIIVDESSTLLDLAYKYSFNDFLTLSSVTVNDERVYLGYKLKGGDSVKFNYSTIVKAKRSWIKLLTSKEAINAVNKYFESVEIENEKINEKFAEWCYEKLGDKFVGENELKARVLKKIGFNSLSEFIEKLKLAKVEESLILAIATKGRVLKETYKKAINIINSINPKNVLYFKGLEGVNYKSIAYPNCCSKIPFTDCIAEMDDKKKIIIHSSDCSKIDLDHKRYMLTWDNNKLKDFPRLFNCVFGFTCITSSYKEIIKWLLDQEIEIQQIISKPTNEESRNVEINLKIKDLNEGAIVLEKAQKKFNIWNMKRK